MNALANYAKYAGQYDRWLYIRQKYNLKWSSGNDSLQSLQRFFDTDLTLDSMVSKVKEMIRVLPAPMGAIIRFAVLTGLRPTEACASVRLLNTSSGLSPQYYNPEQQCLEHFRFPEIFLRQTKKCYLSYITQDQLSAIGVLGSRTPTWNAIRLTCKRRHIDMNMHLCRKIFASWLRKEGITPEIVDLLQGRVSQSILTRHYLAPSQNMKDDVLKALEKLQQQL
jgi:intergrase/recombinase